MNRLGLFIAQGFNVGRIPVAPGTFGSLVGLVWFALLLQTGTLWLFLMGTFFGALVSVWLCGFAENRIGKKDPGSVVLDEITAMPACFLGYLGKYWADHHSLPSIESFFGRNGWYVTLVIFVLFRIFDVTKPWPIRASQAFIGGWGITIDDFVAAAYVTLISFGLSFVLPWPAFRF